MKTGLIACGALARELQAIITRHGWSAEIIGIPALDHVFPERIAPHVEEKIIAFRQQYDQLIIVFGDCGTRGALDEVVEKYGVLRLDGPHCYEMYAGGQFEALMDEELGTFFLTDFMVRTFRGLIVKGMGLDRFPQLKELYFQNYRRIVYLVQKPEPELVEQARAVAQFLGLPLEVNATGYGELERRLANYLNGFEIQK